MCSASIGHTYICPMGNNQNVFFNHFISMKLEGDNVEINMLLPVVSDIQ